ncbi:MAG TPA: hypothetical protein VE863_17320 [Pyrinomonadaceae bacterium]|jgi:hypothetical protein|nr:hypothetical protein [Pyrinomonadaceae bacterium]
MILDLATGSRGAPNVQLVSAATTDLVAFIFEKISPHKKDAANASMLTMTPNKRLDD